VHCGHDYRATLGASLLERAGYDQLVVLDDGWEGWVALDPERPRSETPFEQHEPVRDI